MCAERCVWTARASAPVGCTPAWSFNASFKLHPPQMQLSQFLCVGVRRRPRSRCFLERGRPMRRGRPGVIVLQVTIVRVWSFDLLLRPWRGWGRTPGVGVHARLCGARQFACGRGLLRVWLAVPRGVVFIVAGCFAGQVVRVGRGSEPFADPPGRVRKPGVAGRPLYAASASARFPRRSVPFVGLASLWGVVRVRGQCRMLACARPLPCRRCGLRPRAWLASVWLRVGNCGASVVSCAGVMRGSLRRFCAWRCVQAC